MDGQPERCGRDSPFLQERQPQLEASVDLAIMRHVHHGQVFVVLHQRPGCIDHQARHPAEATTLHGPQELQGRTLRRQVLGDRGIRRPRPPGVVVCHPGAGRPPTPDRETQHRSLFPASVPTRRYAVMMPENPKIAIPLVQIGQHSRQYPSSRLPGLRAVAGVEAGTRHVLPHRPCTSLHNPGLMLQDPS